MEKRIGAVTILLEDTSTVATLNSLLNEYGDIILGRQGLPIRERGIRIISLIVEGTTDEIGAMTGKIGRLPGVQVKSVLTKYREVIDEDPSQDLS
jgi:putative iron-only hydrogenase system regulator